MKKIFFLSLSFVSVELPHRVMCNLLIKMAAIEERLASGCIEEPQVSALVSAFHIARDQVTADA